jgi:preprotein translocase subunit YajC
MEGLSMNESLSMVLAQAAGTTEGQAPAAAPAAPAAPAGDQGQPAAPQTTAPGGPEQPATEQKTKSLWDMGVPLLLMFVVLYFLMFRGPRKKQQQHKQMLENLKKNDRIRTIGGIIATVVDVRGDEVVVKIDEANNTKMHVIRNAIGEVLVEKDETAKS